MAYWFDGANTDDYLENTGTQPITTNPLSMSCFFLPLDKGAISVPLFLGQSGATNVYYRLGFSAAGKASAAARNTTLSAVESGNSGAFGQWHHLFASFTTNGANTDIVVVLDGDWVNRGTGSTVGIPITCNRFTIGVQNTSSGPAGQSFGAIQKVAVWGTTVTERAVRLLAQGAEPFGAKASFSGNLLQYWYPLENNYSQVGLRGVTLTPAGTVRPYLGGPPCPGFGFRNTALQRKFLDAPAAAGGWGLLLGQRRNRLVA